MHYKKLAITCLSCILALSISVTPVYASDINWVSDITDNQSVSKEDVETSLNNIDDINTQVDNLYTIIADNIGLDEKYIKELHVLAGGKAIYSDKKANIYNDKTVDTYSGPMHINGASTVYQKAEFIECADETIERPSEYYLPDAMYSVSYDIKALMSQRMFYNRDTYQEYFNALTNDTRDNILFYEAVLLYTGENVETVNNLLLAYMEILTAKGANENIIEIIEDKPSIKAEYIEILNKYGFISDRTLQYLAIVLSYDENMAVYDNTNYITETNVLPYIKNYTSRENMMVSAISLVGKVRYVWGGGHDGTANIDGINPAWYSWSEAYPSEAISEVITTDKKGNKVLSREYNSGFGTCIRSSSYWCPLHGGGSSEFHGKTVFSTKDYLSIRENIIDYNKYSYDDYMSILSQIDFSGGVNEHIIDGLDCSGYASWIYNQITDKYTFNAAAQYFTTQNGIQEVTFGSDLLPGDVFAWDSHIVVIVGKVKDGSKAYVTVEQTPNILRFGVVYYNGASSKDINSAIQIANEANELIGGINIINEPTKQYCMNTVGYYTETSTLIDEETGEEIVSTENKHYTSIGRYNEEFIDENTIVTDYGTSIENMTAQQIIQYTLTKLPLSYVLGYNVYDGDLFNKELVSSNLGISLPELDETE